MRRVNFSHGDGRLWVGHGRLLFVNDAAHSAIESLEDAAQVNRPSRALAAAVIAADFDVPPFVFAEDGEHLNGIVYGAIEVRVDDIDSTVVSGADAEPWAQFAASPAAVVSASTNTDGGLEEGLWLEAGAVRAGGFRWLPSPQDADMAKTARPVARGLPRVRPDKPSPANRDPAGLPASQPSAAGIPSVDPDATVDARAVATVLRRMEDEAQAPNTDSEATIILAPGEILLDGQPEEDRLVEALVCGPCSMPNPPCAARCRGCSSLLSTSDSSTCRVPQPVLGMIHLSGGPREPLDADLLIGRNPAYQALSPNQRAVVHGVGDRSVSRRHIELRLDGWNVIATNFKKGASTIVKGRDGVCTTLLTSTPRQLDPGDTIHFGRAWLRYEPA